MLPDSTKILATLSTIAPSITFVSIDMFRPPRGTSLATTINLLFRTAIKNAYPSLQEAKVNTLVGSRSSAYDSRFHRI